MSDQAGGRVLVAHASRFGTTSEVAEVVAESVRRRGLEVEAWRIGDVRELVGYDTVIVGAPIHYDNWTSQARAFIAENEEALSRVPVAYFFTCGTLFDQSDKARGKAQKYADAMMAHSALVTPISIGQFAGSLDYSRMNLPTRLVLRTAFTIMGVGEGDRRNWATIRTWAEALTLETIRMGNQ